MEKILEGAVLVFDNVTGTRITGGIGIHSGAWVGAYNVNITLQYAGPAPGTGKFSVTKTVPTITSIAPATSWRNAVVSS
jgi:hypothetical protein